MQRRAFHYSLQMRVAPRNDPFAGCHLAAALGRQCRKKNKNEAEDKKNAQQDGQADPNKRRVFGFRGCSASLIVCRGSRRLFGRPTFNVRQGVAEESLLPSGRAGTESERQVLWDCRSWPVVIPTGASPAEIRL